MNILGNLPRQSDDAPVDSSGVEIRLAKRLDDYWHAMRLIRKYSADTVGHRRRPGVGETLSRLRHRGSGPGSGCLLIARQDNEPIGCIALLIDNNGTARTDWLAVREPALHGAVAMLLVRRAYEQAKIWGVRRLACEPAAPWDAPPSSEN